MFVEILKYFLAIVISYFIGNISFARMISEKVFNKDITKIGSKNPGTINMTRSHGVGYGFATFILDILKSAIPSLIAYFIGGPVLLYIAGFSCVLGHVYPVVYKFKGGKGIACSIGIFLVSNPLFTLLSLILGLIVLLWLDYGAIATLTIVSVMTIFELVRFSYTLSIPIICILACLYALIIFRHVGNIKRLLKGEESKLNLKEKLKRKSKND